MRHHLHQRLHQRWQRLSNNSATPGHAEQSLGVSEQIPSVSLRPMTSNEVVGQGARGVVTGTQARAQSAGAAAQSTRTTEPDHPIREGEPTTQPRASTSSPAQSSALGHHAAKGQRHDGSNVRTGKRSGFGTSRRQLPPIEGSLTTLAPPAPSTASRHSVTVPGPRREDAHTAAPQLDTAPPSAGSKPASAGATHAHFRPDIEGLRAIAVLAVVLYHAGITSLHGGFIGVDVFFVISGFLITSQLLKEIGRSGTVDLAQFWARRARRLLPAVSTMLAVTSVAIIVLWPAMRKATALVDVAAAAIYGANWRFIATNVEYGGTGERSPVLHLWSLGVEEQFYLVWPLLMLAAVLLARHRRWSLTRTLAVGIGAVWVASLAASWICSPIWGPFAYYSLPTRAWQLASGALLALAATQVGRITSRWRAALGWAGLATIAVSILTLSEGGSIAYPGTIALIPTLAAVAVIASGLGSLPTAGPVVLLRAAPLQFIGRLSYGWYLWHWPFVVMAPSALNRGVSVVENLALSAAALGVAWVSYHLVENPIRRSTRLAPRPVLSLALGAALTLLPAVAAYGVIRYVAGGAVSTTVQLAGSASERENAQPQEPTGQRTQAVREQRLAQSPVQAKSDRGMVTSHCQLNRTRTQPAERCTFGAKDSSQHMILVGDSHASHWFPPLEQVALQENLALTVWTKSWCQLTDVDLILNGQPYPSCSQWRAEVMQRLRANPPRTIVVSGLDVLGHRSTYFQLQVADPDTGAALSAKAAEQVWQQGYTRMLEQLRATGARVVVIADTPVMGSLVPDCLAQTGSVPRCSTPRSKAMPTGQDKALALQAGLAPADVWDFTESICGPRTCSAVNGDSIVWWDRTHLTATFAASLSEQMLQRYRTGSGSTNS